MAPDALLAITGLNVAFDVDGRPTVGVHNVSFDVGPGEVVAVVGESGSGKTVTAMSVLGLLPQNACVTGSIRYDGEELVGLTARSWRRLRGAQIGMIFQDPVAALNPVLSIGFQLSDVVRLGDRQLSGPEVRQRVVELLEMVGIDRPAGRLKDYPHEFSGGQCQRIVIALALARRPRLLIADEPTTALDVTVQAEILDVLRRLGRRHDSSILLITHNMGVVADLADRVVVMRAGEVVEVNSCTGLFAHPRATYTKSLLAAVPKIGDRPASEEEAAKPANVESCPALAIEDLTVEYGSRRRGLVRAVGGVDLHVDRGEIVGLVGESGSGKTTLGRAVVGLAPVSAGRIRVSGQDVAQLTRSQRQALRREVGVVFQNPAASLNPRYSIGATVTEPLRVLGGLTAAQASARADELLVAVGLGPQWRDRYPHELSGGQRQRVAIARAVALDPVLLIADEPTSALDVSVQAQVLDVFRELQSRLGFACLFISHDLAVVDSLSHRVAVMHLGQIVESGDRSTVLHHPQADYTQRLLASAPVPDPLVQRARHEKASSYA
jgi:peptide/nickel transport system ATP-binding protein